MQLIIKPIGQNGGNPFNHIVYLVHFFGTQRPPQSAPPVFGLQSSLGSSMQTSPGSSQGNPANPPQNCSTTQIPRQSTAIPQGLVGSSMQISPLGHGRPRRPPQ
ncbi:hypothetical protein ABW19_dt0209855 [Dactylella cylindrospora]|nr:hypothetical protein ABW19_dt0209855 [Dactylella cylindrospora]